jgi:hypothetical protein
VKKFFIIFCIVGFLGLVAPWFLLEYPKHVAKEVNALSENSKKVDEEKKETKVQADVAEIKEEKKLMDPEIARGNDISMRYVIEDLEVIKSIFCKNKKIMKEARELLVEAKILRKELKKISTEKQKKIAIEKVEKFFARHDPFTDKCIAIYGEMMMKKYGKPRPAKTQAKGVKEA